MTDNKKIEILEKVILNFEVYQKNLKKENIQNFENLKSQILSLLEENEKVRFSQIEFYSEQDDFNNIMSDDLPF